MNDGVWALLLFATAFFLGVYACVKWLSSKVTVREDDTVDWDDRPDGWDN